LGSGFVAVFGVLFIAFDSTLGGIFCVSGGILGVLGGVLSLVGNVFSIFFCDVVSSIFSAFFCVVGSIFSAFFCVVSSIFDLALDLLRDLLVGFGNFGVVDYVNCQ